MTSEDQELVEKLLQLAIVILRRILRPFLQR